MHGIRQFKGKRGVATVEYVVGLGLLVVLSMAVLVKMPGTLSEFYLSIASVVCSPVP